MSDSFNILVSSAGRRVALVQHFQTALRELGMHGRVFAADLNLASSACHAADHAYSAPLFSTGRFIDEMLALCEREKINLVVPTIDPELSLYAEHRERFAEIGAIVAVSSPQAVAIGADKRETHRWLSGLGLPVPRQASIEQVKANPDDWPTPLIIKPARGSSSIGMRKITHHEELAGLEETDDMVAESIAPGGEYTIDVYIDRSGKPRCSVPRLRLETRAGEVSKGQTVRDPHLQEIAERIASELPGGFGVINIQIFYDKASGQTAVIEINARFGGGYPLTHHAGATCTHWLIEDCLGLPISVEPDAWRDGLVMLRYDDAVFVDQSEIASA